MRGVSARDNRKGAALQSEKDRKRLEAEQRQKMYRILLPVRTEIEKAEREIARMESRRLEIQTAMASPDAYKLGDEAKRLSHEDKELQADLQRAYDAWNKLTEQLEDLQRQAGGA